MQNLRNLIKFSKGLNILFIEDNIDVREQLNKLLENFFSNISLCFNGLEAIEEYQRFKRVKNNFYDLIITDISMPKLDGIELCKEILKQNPKQEILVISAHTEKQKLKELSDLGVEHILQKPVEHKSLINALSKIINNIQNTTRRD